MSGREAPALAAPETVLRLDAVSKLYGPVVAVDGASLEIKRGEVFTLLGPSGCGKTTTLRLVAGLERPDAGEIALRGRLVASAPAHRFVPPHRRNLGMVFQSYAIWPHMTVFDNVAYPLTLRGERRAAVRDKVARVLGLVGLAGLEQRSATLLSGGQMQRLALCRALVYEPDLLLLDEPFSNLDAKLREQMRVELKLLQRRLGITVLFVTHDQVEALSLSDRIAVMRQGRVEQVGPPRSLYDLPASAFVRDFLGQTVILRARTVDASGAVGASMPSAAASADGRGRDVTVALDGALDGRRLAGRAAPGAALLPGAEAHVAIRPEDIEVAPGDDEPRADNSVGAAIEALLFVGDRYEARVVLGAGAGDRPPGDAHPRILLLLPRAREWREGQRLRLTFPAELVSVWPV